MTSSASDWLPLPRRVLLAISGFAAVLLLAALIYTAFEAEQGSSGEGQLKLGAAKLVPVLQLSGSGYDTIPSFYLLFKRFVQDERSALIGPAAARLQRNQWAQVLVYDGRSLPPQVVLLSLPSHRPVRIDIAAVNTVLQKRHATLTSAHASGISIRAYLVPLKMPAIFQGQDVSAVLELFQKS